MPATRTKRKKSTKQNGHGGARPGAGRPRVEDPRNKTFALAVTEDELAELRDASAGEWARDVLLKSARRRMSR